MSIFALPENLIEIRHFTIPKVQTWGKKTDALYKEMVLSSANLSLNQGDGYDGFVFAIRCVVGQSRGRYFMQIPDVENIPKLIVDAFTGVLYPDDNLHYVRGVQVEAEWGPDDEERAEVWIFGISAERR